MRKIDIGGTVDQCHHLYARPGASASIADRIFALVVVGDRAEQFGVLEPSSSSRSFVRRIALQHDRVMQILGCCAAPPVVFR